jgi:hypothetical protein
MAFAGLHLTEQEHTALETMAQRTGNTPDEKEVSMSARQHESQRRAGRCLHRCDGDPTAGTASDAQPWAFSHAPGRDCSLPQSAGQHRT